MEKALFDDLVQSLKAAEAIADGDAPASRWIKVTTPDAKAVREQIALSQSEFAQLMRFRSMLSVKYPALNDCREQSS